MMYGISEGYSDNGALDCHVIYDTESGSAIGCVEDIEILKSENQALRDALRVRIEHCYCPECNVHMEWAKHSKTCRHYQTEREVMAKV